MLSRRGAMTGAAMTAIGTRAWSAQGSERLKALVDPSNPQAILGVAVIARDARGRVRFAEAAGRAIAGSGELRREQPFSLDAPVRVASISKLALAVGLMRLVEAGRADLDEDVSEGLGFRLRHPAHPEVKITPAMLASHTSGLRDTASYPLPLGRRLADAYTPGAGSYEKGAGSRRRRSPQAASSNTPTPTSPSWPS
jgi:CubicO group peptidase (beta-lactamase class C family)